MKRNLRKVLSVLVALVLFLQCTPLAALAEIIVESSSSVRLIDPEKAGIYVTYEFYANAEDTTPVATQIVNQSKGETASLVPATPAAGANQEFIGWYLEDGTTKYATGAVTAYTENTTVKVIAKYDTVYYVYFMTVKDADGNRAVHASVKANSENGFKAAAPTDYEPKGARVTGWYLDEGLTTAYDANVAVEKDTYVYPATVACHWVSFDTQGGSSVASKYLGSTETLNLTPITATRTGFTFKGWSTTDDGLNPVTEVSNLAEDITLYAIWAGEPTEYTIVYWGENADDEDYSVIAVGKGEANAETTVQLMASSAAAALPSTYADRAHFTFEKSDAVKILADGSSVVNVYYTRNEYTLTFKTSSNGSTVATIKAKYNAEISGKFKEAPFNTTYNGRAWDCTDSSKYGYALQTLDRMPGFDATFTLYRKSSETLKTIYYYGEKVGANVSSTSWPSNSNNFELLKTVDTYFNYATYEEEYHPIQGFDRYSKSVSGFSGNDKDFSNNELDLYYLRKSYNLIYKNYGDEDPVSVEYQESLKDYNITPAKPDGFSDKAKFKGWYLVDPANITSSTPKFDFDNSTMPTSDLVLHAYWAEPDVNVDAIVKIDDSNETHKIVVPRGKTIASTAKYAEVMAIIEASGKTLLKWVNHETGAMVNVNAPMTEDMTIRAVFAGDSFTISYDGNGNTAGTVPTDSHKYEEDAVAKAASGAGLVKGTDVFVYWTDEAGNIIYPGKDVVIGAVNVTLTANYAPVEETVKITYHTNPVSGSDKTSVATGILNNNEVTLSGFESVFSKSDIPEGYRFAGWATSENGSVIADNTVRVNDASASNDVYAIWEPDLAEYVVHHYLKGTTIQVADDVTGTDTIGKTLIASAVTVSGLTADAATKSIEIQLDATKNVITFEYTAALKITAGSAEKVYDGKALTQDEFTVEGLVNGDTDKELGVVMTEDSTITNVGEQANKVDEAKVTIPGYYTVTYVPGTLKVTKVTNEIVVTADSNEQVYNGQALTDNGYTYTGTLAEGDKLTAVVEGTITNVGSADNVVTSYKVENAKGEDVTAFYTFGTSVKGTLTVTPATLTITTPDANKEYDGEALTAEGSISGFVNNETATFTTTGTQTEVGSSANTYSLVWNGTATEGNYTISETIGTLEVTKSTKVIKVVANSNEWNYDGAEHADGGYTVTFGDEKYTVAAGESATLSTGDTVTATITKTVKDVADTAAGNNVIDNLVVANADQYEKIESEAGTLTIKPIDATVTIVGKNATNVYDGAEHKVEGYTATANTKLYDVTKDFTFSGNAVAARTEEGTTNMGLVADQFANTNSNFATVTFNVTDGYQTITPVDEVVVTITEHSDEVDYDGKAHTVTGYDVEISNPLYKEADFTFGGTANVSGTNVGTYNMELKPEDFENKNSNFAKVTFVIVDGQLVIKPIDVTVTITGHNNTTEYNGEEHTVTGYTATADTDLYNVTKDFTFSGTATATQTNVGTAYMGLAADQFKNTNDNFKTVTFEVTDGYQTIEPIDVTVTIVGANNTTVYDGEAHTVTGYTATASTKLYDVENDFTFSGTATATQTNVGTAYMGLAADQFKNENANFATVTFNVTDGYQTITPLEGVVVTITEKSGEEDYDGTEKTVTGYTAKASSDLYDVTKDFTFAGNDSVSGIDADTYDMELKPADFTNTNTNFADVTFVIKDGQLVIKPIDVTVTIVGANNTSVYDGTEHKVEGYTATADTELYDVENDFTFSGTAVAARTEEGTTNMGLAADQFANTNGNFATVTFNVTDGYQTITPVDVVVVTIVGNTATNEYDGNEHKITGYTATANNDLYDVTKDFTFSGTAEAARTEVGTTYMGLVDTQFANTNGNFSKVTFVVTDGYQTITPVDDEVVVTIVGKNNTAAYDGAEHTVTGYDVTEISNSLYKEADFVFNGTAEAKRTDAGTTNMGLAADQFENTNDNFANVTFNVIDGYQTITPIDVTVTIVGANNTTEYDGVEHEVSGYTATANTELYDVTKDFTFSGTAVAARTDVGQTDMSLAADQFANTNSNFATVTFEVTDGYQKITPVAEEVVVTIVGKNNTTDYDGTEHGVNGYDVTNISNELYTAADFSFSGTAEAKRTDAGQTEMGLNAEQFSNTNTNFSKVTFQVTDGYQKINPIDVIVTIVGKNATNVYDGAEHKVEGYTATADTKLYDVTKDFTFSGNAVAARTEEGTTNMGLAAEQFANTNGNFATVTFNVTDGYQTITPMTDEVVVTIVGNNVTKTYDGVEYVASGYEVTNISNSLYTEADFVFNSTAEAKRTDVGTTEMGLAAEQFKNTSADFANVKFVVTDGYVTINPRPITVIAASDEKVYDATALTNGNYLVLDGTYAAAPENATFDQDGETIVKKITATVSGSQTLVGKSANTVATVTIDGTQYAATAEKFGNYAVTFIAGILAVTDEGADEDLVVNKTHEDKEYALGETVTFTITVKNIYAEAKTITITEKAGVTLVGGTDGKLVIEDVAPGAEVTATATYVITSDDILAGTFVNEVEVSFDGGSTFGDEDPVDPEKLDTTLTVEKTSDTEGNPVVLDQVITYTIKVTNDGNVPFYNVKVTDEWTKDNWTIAELKVGETKEFTTTYTVTSDDILAGKVVNEVVAKGNPVKDPEGGEKTPEGKDDVTDTSDELDTTLDVEKTSDKEGKKVELGEKITYTITVTNKGNVPFYNVKVVDELVALEKTIAELAVGATETFTATYTVTSDDILAGEVVNSVTATADPVKDPDGEDKIPADDDEITDEPGDLNTALEVVKTSDVAEGETVSLGDTITYTIKVTNKGNVPFYNVVVKDAMVDFEKTIAELAVGATETFTVTYVVTSDDIKAGEIVNAVTAEGDPIDDPKNPDDPKKPEGGDEEEDPTDDLNTTLEVVKTTISTPANGETYALNETIKYEITVTNKGNVPFTNVIVTDELTGDSWTIAELAVGATETFTAEYTVVEDDIKAGSVINEVVAKGDEIDDPKKPDEPKKPEGEDDVEDPTDKPNPAYTIVKVRTDEPANGEFYELGEEVEFEITVTNTGNVTLNGIVVKEELEGALFENGTDEMTIETLPPFTKTEGENVVKFTATYVITEDDLGNDDLANTLSAKDSDDNEPDPIKPEPIPVDDVTSVTVAKVWDDLNNKYNTRTAVTVNLLADGEVYGEPAVIAEDEDGNWNSVTFEKLPVHKNGEEIVYTVEEVAVPGYDAAYANDGNSWTITNTLQQYTLTIRHWIHFVDGEVAAPNYERTVYYGESYSVRSPNVKGFWPNPRYTTGIVTGNMVHDVIYDELDFTLTVQYVYQNGATAAPTHVQKKLHYGDDYRVVSPKLEGYVASYPEISGYMGTRDLSFTVIYVPENTIIIDEYGVPLGLGNVEMNVGECFE